MNFKEMLIKQYNNLPKLYDIEIWEDVNQVYVWNKEDKKGMIYQFDDNNNLKYTC